MSWVYEYYWGASSQKPEEEKNGAAQKDEENKAEDRLSNDSDLLIPEEVSGDDRGGRVDTSIDQQPSFFFDHASRIEHVDDNQYLQRNTSHRVLFKRKLLPGGNNNTTF